MNHRRLAIWIAGVLAALLLSCNVEKRVRNGLIVGEGEALVFLYLSSANEAPPRLEFELISLGFQDISGQWFDIPLNIGIESREVSKQQIKLCEVAIPAGHYVGIRWVLAKPAIEIEGKLKPMKFANEKQEVAQQIEFEADSRESIVFFADWDILGSIVGPEVFTPRVRFSPESASISDAMLLVACRDSNTVFLVDRRSDRVVGAIEVGRAPLDVAVTPNRMKAYVANSRSNNFTVIDLHSARVSRNVENLGYSPKNMAISSNGRWLMATNPDVDRVTIVDLSVDQLSDTVTVGRKPNDVIADETGSLFFVSNSDSNSVSVVDASTGRVVREIQVGLNPTGLALQDELLYVANTDSSTLSVVNARTLVVEKTISVPSMPLWVHSGLYDRIYLTNKNRNRVSFILLQSEAIVDSIAAGKKPEQMDVDTLRKKIYVSEPAYDRVYVIDAIRKSKLTIIQVGNNPGGIAVVQ